ncbi:hypothetical protein [Spirulina sp. 06S082]|uniref:hypothetical protein n=1 Tax=Spirulina sp. 06S082 TaxID=3110248 RepID=UPI002B215100|nr:hypothetical protein [Spirulina sp. 06S082]MEA5468310.1 hypothetical protein [Spirulina sp. 06S082]
MPHSIQLSFLREGQQGFEIDERYIVRPPKPESAKDSANLKASDNPSANPSQYPEDYDAAIAPEISAA